MKHTPRYEHDCDNCTFLGRLVQYDIYACPQVGCPTVIARWASEGPMYFSGNPLCLFGLSLSPNMDSDIFRDVTYQAVAHLNRRIENGVLKTQAETYRLALQVLGELAAMWHEGLLDLDRKPEISDVTRFIPT